MYFKSFKAFIFGMIICMTFETHLTRGAFNECAVGMYSRRACGKEGVQPEECIALGCCWDACWECEIWVPWCYDAVEEHPRPPPPRSRIESEEDVDKYYY